VKMVQIAVPEDLHTLVKIKAAEQRTTLTAYILDTLRASVEKGGKQKTE
jgi:predicted HicB family RNase H-like nuclease